MSIVGDMLGELVYESANTRKLLERVPEEFIGWQPHPKSMTLGQLSSHLAEIPQWVKSIVTDEEMEFDPEQYVPTIYTTNAELLKTHDAAVEDAKKALDGMTDDQLNVIWRLKTPKQILCEMPRGVVLRTMVLNHAFHHRGQLTVYLRLKDVPLPALYGPSADEKA